MLHYIYIYSNRLQPIYTHFNVYIYSKPADMPRSRAQIPKHLPTYTHIHIHTPLYKPQTTTTRRIQSLTHTHDYTQYVHTHFLERPCTHIHTIQSADNTHYLHTLSLTHTHTLSHTHMKTPINHTHTLTTDIHTHMHTPLCIHSPDTTHDIQSKTPYVHSKEPCRHSKEPYKHPKEP